MQPIVIIPALNPDARLITLARQLAELGLQMVVVNDGSDLAGGGVFDELRTVPGCVICSHQKNLGKGAALKTGIRYVASHYPACPGYVTADADGQHTPTDIWRVAASLERHPGSLILGTRDFRERTVPWKSLWGNRITSAVFRITTGRRCPDTQTGLRGIPRRFTDVCLAIPENRYEYEMSLLLKSANSGTHFVHVPIATVYLEQNRSSHFHAVRDSARIYLNILKYSCSSLCSATVDLALFTLLVDHAVGRGVTGTIAATIAARLTSGALNFRLNRRWVFQSSGHPGECARYLALFVGQMLASSLLIAGLSCLPFNLTFGKVLVDGSLFLVSYHLQKKYVFR